MAEEKNDELDFLNGTAILPGWKGRWDACFFFTYMGNREIQKSVTTVMTYRTREVARHLRLRSHNYLSIYASTTANVTVT